MHSWKDLRVDFNDVMKQYEPMIYATMRNLNIYKNHDYFQQAARVALWQAWTRYDERIGHFAPFAARSIRGAMLDVLKKENSYEQHVVAVEDKALHFYCKNCEMDLEQWSEEMERALRQLTERERQYIHWFYVERRTQAECARLEGITIAAIKKRRERMMKKLRVLLTTKEL